jgi:hypothetical protein
MTFACRARLSVSPRNLSELRTLISALSLASSRDGSRRDSLASVSTRRESLILRASDSEVEEVPLQRESGKEGRSDHLSREAL